MITKTTMRKWLVPVVAMVALGMLVADDTAWAQPPDGPGPRAGRAGRREGPPPGGQLMHLRWLDLSEAQREQIRSIHEQSGEATQAADERVRAARQDAVTADVVNEGAIRAVATELGIAEGDAAVQRAYVHAQVWQMLTPEQQAAAREAEAEMQARAGQRRQRMGERRWRRQGRRQEG